MSSRVDSKAVAVVHDHLGAIPITPPSPTGERDTYHCNIEHHGQLYSLTWFGGQQWPDLSAFPNLRTGKLSLLNQSLDMLDLKRHSAFVVAGAHASIRRVRSPDFPILKLAHPDDFSMALVRHEYEMIKRFSELALPVPAVSYDPILDNGQICGYKMEELYQIIYEEMQNLSTEVKEAVLEFHEAGYSHGDLSPSNVMKNINGRVTLIDVSFSGKLDDRVPSWFPLWAYSGSTFVKDGDLERLKKYWR